MNLSEVFIRRPIATALIMAGIGLFGLLAYQLLPVADLPNVDFPTITVSASLPGASPETMASAVATPLERQFTGIAGLDSLTSTNSMGNTQISLQFDLSRQIDGAAVDVQTAISAALPLLPSGMPSPPSFRKSNPSDSPIIFMGLISDTMPLTELNEYAETMIAQRISMVNGVAQVGVFGAAKYAVRVRLDPDRMAARRIGINEVERAVQSWNINLPTGTIQGPDRAMNIKANGQLMRAEGYQGIVVSSRGSTPVYLRDVAKVEDSVEDDRSVSWLYERGNDGPGRTKGVRGINIFVMRQPDSNVIETVDAVKKLIPVFNAQLPPSVKLAIRGDRSKNIREAFHEIQITMLLTAALVIGVIFLFLRNLSATLIPSLALPFSIIGTFSIMNLLGFSLNNLSMMALILSVGFVVDDAIVMLENVVRHMERGLTPMQAAMIGSREVSFTIVSMTLSLAAVFIPVLFMGGILGRLFREFAVTIAVAVLISGVVSVTLTPMLCSRLLRHDHNEKKNWFFRFMEKWLDLMTRIYGASLRWVLRFRPVMAVLFVGILVATFWLFEAVPKGFIPSQDSDQMYINVEAAQGTSHHRMAELQKALSDVVAQDPDIDNFMSNAGGSAMFGGSANTGRMYISLKPRAERTSSVEQIIERLRPKLNQTPGIRGFATAPSMIRIGSRSSKSQYEITIQGPDTRELYRHAATLEREMQKAQSIQDVTSDLQIRSPRLRLTIDRDRAASLGLNAEEIESALYGAYGPKWVSTIYAPNNQFRVLLELEPKYQTHPDLLSLINFKSSDGRLIPLDAIISQTADASPQTINHAGQLPAVGVSFNMKPGHALGEAVEEINELARHVLPGDVKTSFQGSAKAFQSSLANMTLLLVVAIAVVYIVLGVLYESFVQPLTILSGIPSAIFGALLTLLIFKVELNIYGFVGLMMLIGIVKKNAIMQLDFALEAERKHGMSPHDAIYEGCIVRFRPIMMTTMAALLSTLPMAIGYGAGAEARRPLGLAVVGGLIFSQLITLYLTPVVYTYMGAAVSAWHRLFGHRPKLSPSASGAD